MNPQIKLIYFEYVVKKLLGWYNEQSRDTQNNDLNILKVLKLLFFVSSARSEEIGDNNILDNVFNNYIAMPYGHVEGDIYNALVLNRGSLTYYFIDNYSTKEQPNVNIAELDNSLLVTYRTEIDLSVEYLKSRNRNLILMKAFDLVDLSHSWYSWRKNFEEAKLRNKLSQTIPVEDIKKEAKLYSLISIF